MKKRLLLGLALSLAFTACNEQKTPAAKVGFTSPDTEKMAYLFGMQLSHHLFAFVPYQVGEGISYDALMQGFEDAYVMNGDSTKKLQLNEI